jgi:hypothetical protein
MSYLIVKFHLSGLLLKLSRLSYGRIVAKKPQVSQGKKHKGARRPFPVFFSPVAMLASFLDQKETGVYT